jgi:hypothetical protein
MSSNFFLSDLSKALRKGLHSAFSSIVASAILNDSVLSPTHYWEITAKTIIAAIPILYCWWSQMMIATINTTASTEGSGGEDCDEGGGSGGILRMIVVIYAKIFFEVDMYW